MKRILAGNLLLLLLAGCATNQKGSVDPIKARPMVTLHQRKASSELPKTIKIKKYDEDKNKWKEGVAPFSDFFVQIELDSQPQLLRKGKANLSEKIDQQLVAEVYFRVEEDGSTTGVKVLSTNYPEEVEAIIELVETFVYAPATRKGRAVSAAFITIIKIGSNQR